MTWDFAEGNPFSDSAGNWLGHIKGIEEVIADLRAANRGSEQQCAAQAISYPHNTVISTDPPYYDNIDYADLADFFYCWLRQNLPPIWVKCIVVRDGMNIAIHRNFLPVLI